MKLLALGLLIAMLLLLGVSNALSAAHPWLNWVHAFAEAAAVGAIADWFAVTALFRHPLGLPIPHTAIIPNNKNEIGASLGNFVEYNFLTPQNIMRKLEERNLAQTAAEWLVHPGNSERVAQRVGELIPKMLEALEDGDVQGFLEKTFVVQLERVDVARVAGELLEILTASNRHQALLDRGLQAIESWITKNRGLIEEKFSEASIYTPGFLDKYIVNRFVEGVTALLHEVASNPEHEIRARFNDAIAEFVINLKTSPEFRQRGETLKRDLLAQLGHGEYFLQLWVEVRGRIVNDLASDCSILREHLSSALMTVGGALIHDSVLQQKLNVWILRGIEGLMLRHRHQISQLITEEVASWDAHQVSEKVEMEIGRDLQFIRINGTLVGGTVGVVLHFLQL